MSDTMPYIQVRVWLHPDSDAAVAMDIREHPQQPTDVYPNHISWVREESHGAPHEWAAA